MGFSFDGVDDKITYGDLAGLDGAAALTYSIWLQNRSADVGVRRAFLAKSSATTVATLNEIIDSTIKTYHGDGTISGVTGDVIDVDWTHIGWVYDGSGSGNAGRQKIYVNGDNQTLTFAGTVPATLGDAGTDVLEIGSKSAAGGSISPFFGRLANLKIWTAALSVTEINQEGHSHRPIRTKNLLLWSPYNPGATDRDYSGNRNNGTNTGAVAYGNPLHIPHQERFSHGLRKRRDALGLPGHRVMP